MDKKIKWGILTTGVIAKHFASTMVQMKDEATLVAVGARTLNSAQTFAKQYDIPSAYGSYEELVADKNIDVIYVASPHSLHYEHVKLCLEAGKHVMCEKSFTVDFHQAKELFALAKEKNLFLMEAFWSKFIPLNQKLLAMIKDGVIGEVQMVRAEYGYITDRMERKMDPNLAGGALLDIGVYGIGFASMILGYYPRRNFSVAKINSQGTDQYETLLLEYSDGKLAQITAAIGTVLPPLATVFGSKGYIDVHEFKAPQTFQVHLNDGTHYAVEGKLEINGFEYQIREVNKCILEGKTESEIMSADNTIETMRIMDCARFQWNMRYPCEK